MSKQYSATREKTQEKIKIAFVALLQEQDYEEISVREIASRAGIGFKTFYRYYADKAAMADELYVEIWKQILDQISEIGLSANPTDSACHILRSAQENAPLVRVFIVLGSYQHALPEITKEFAREQVRVYRPDIFESDGVYTKNLQSLVVTYFMAGQVELLRWWLLQDHMTLPVEKLVSVIVQLVIQPIMTLQLPHSGDVSGDL